MNDFLSNLVARSFTDAPAIQPRLPSLFESSVSQAAAETESLAEPGIADGTSASINAAPVTPAQNKVAPTNTEPMREEQPPQRQLTELKPGNADQPYEETIAIQDAGKKLFAPIIVAETQLLKSKKIIASPTTRPASHISKEFSEPGRIANRQSSPFAVETDSFAAAPTINVTIGRVEVRAIHSPTPAQKPAKSAPPKLSLDDYLQNSGRPPR